MTLQLLSSLLLGLGVGMTGKAQYAFQLVFYEPVDTEVNQVWELPNDSVCALPLVSLFLFLYAEM